MASFSNRRHDLIDLVTVGVDVLSSVPGGGFDKESGTSMAAPAAAGAFAALRSAFPEAPLDDILFAIKRPECALDPAMGLSYPCIDLAVATMRLESELAIAATMAAPEITEDTEISGSIPDASASTRFIISLSSGAGQGVYEAVEAFAANLDDTTVHRDTALGDRFLVLETAEPRAQEEIATTLRDRIPEVDRVFVDMADPPAR